MSDPTVGPAVNASLLVGLAISVALLPVSKRRLSNDSAKRRLSNDSAKRQLFLERQEAKTYVADEPTVIIVTLSALDRARLALEWLLVLMQVVLSFVLAKTWPQWVVCVFWIYDWAIVNVRRVKRDNTLWYHSAGLYTIGFYHSLWMIGAFVLKGGDQKLIASAGISILLFILICSAPLGDCPARLYSCGSQPSPEPVSSIFSRVAYTFVDPLVWLGYKTHLEPSMVWQLPQAFTSQVQLDAFENTTGPLLKRLVWVYKFDLLSTLICAVVFSVTSLAPSWFIQQVLRYVNNRDDTIHGAVLVCGILVLSFTNSGLRHQGRNFCRNCATKLTSLLTSEIYTKALKKKLNETDTGGVITLMMNDTKAISTVVDYSFHIVWSALSVLLAIAFLYYLLGWSSLVGVVVLLALSPVNVRFAQSFGGYHRQILALQEQINSKLNELLQSIRVIKFFAWENEFGRQIQQVRHQELGFRRRMFVASSLFNLFMSAMPFIITTLTFAFYTTVQREELTSAVAFPALSVFFILHFQADMFAHTMNAVAQGKISLERIQNFFNGKETKKHENVAHGEQFKFDNATVGWRGSFELTANFEIPSGKLTVVTGDTGSGKTALLLALLGEVDVVSGVVTAPRNVAYCAQQPWLLNDTIKNNILFGSKFDKARYDAVVSSCALVKDLELLEYDDETEIGDRGITLSGGQKQRVALARAVYTQNEYLLLDDCLSAVDSHTAVELYQNCITGLAKGRTIVLVSNNVELAASRADKVVSIKDGAATLHQNSYTDFTTQESPQTQTKETTDGKVNHEEVMARGAVNRTLYWKYLALMGSSWFILVLLTAYALERVSSIGQALWLRQWTESESTSVAFYLSIYAAIGISSTLLKFGQQLLTYYGGLNASKILFGQLLDSVLNAKIRVFDTTPVGRILNRFSSDIRRIDELPREVTDFLENWFQLGATTILIASITPWYLLVAFFVAALYYATTVLFIKSSRELQRIVSVTRSPIYQHFGESLQGVDTIRAFGHQQRFIEANIDKLNAYNAPFYYMWQLNRWMFWRADAISSVVVASAAAFVVSNRSIDAGLAGVSLTFANDFSMSVYLAMRLTTVLELGMNSVERVEEYSRLDTEVDDGAVVPPKSWPDKGAVSFDNVSISYGHDSPVVINQVSFCIPARSKIGIVGRTGAGKTTIASSLFRFVEAQSGDIKIDGLDISKVGLKNLRESLAIVPQDPTLFAGTLRYNLDPFGQFSDRQVARALKRVHLTEELCGLEFEIKQGGTNISQGQRQLICLARSLLKRPKVLILDEATASIDYSIDAKIQRTIREELVGTTLITIAHRLNTIKDYDSVLVLADGQVVQHDSPQTLLQQEGPFKEMCQKSGDF